MKNLILILIYVAVFSSTISAQTWSPLSTGTSWSVNCMTIYNGSLYAGGLFGVSGGVTVNRVAKWDGSSWYALNGGANDEVTAMAVYNNELVIAGSFTKVD